MFRTALVIAIAMPFTFAPAAPLRIVDVGAPAINCVFDTDCRIYVTDFSDAITLMGGSGSGFLQSRLFPPGQPGTQGEGLYPYVYRIDIRNIMGILAIPCIHTFRINFGPVVPLDYDGDGRQDHVWVTTSGGLGSVGPASAELVGNTITFRFNPSICAGGYPGGGQTSYFFGLASVHPPQTVTAEIEPTIGDPFTVQAKAPELAAVGDPRFRRGDANVDGQLNIADGIGVLNFLFANGPTPPCMDAADANDNGSVEIADAIGVLNNLFGDRMPLEPPVGECGVDPTPDRLGCQDFPPCPTDDRCPDPAAVEIQFQIVRRDAQYRGRVRITGVVRNVGGPFDSNPGQQSAYLYEGHPGGSPTLVATQPFVDLAPGAVVNVVYEREWNASSPAEGEFPPTYFLRILYDPDIYIDGNPDNDDCNGGNNQRERSGMDINDMFMP